VFPISTATILFQLLLILSSIYFSMLLTDWGNPNVMDSGNKDAMFFEPSYQSFWINVAAMWVSQAIYIFSLTAPWCIDRDFS